MPTSRPFPIRVAARAVPMVALILVVTGSTVAAGSPSSMPRTPSAGGARVWVARDAGAHNAYDQVAGMTTSPDGSTVYVARTSAGKVAVVAHDALTGATRWSASTRDPGGLQIFAEAVAISPDGTRLFVTGDVEQSTDTRAARTIAYDTADGSVVWTANIDVPANREIIPRRIIVDPDGTRVFVTGARTGTHGSGDFWDYDTVAYAAATGTRLWKAIFDGPAHGGDTPEGLGVSPDGSKVFVTGTSKDGGANDRDFVTIAYRADDGSPQWTSRYSVGADNFAVGLVVSPDGSTVYVAGYGRAAINLPHDYELVAYRSGTGTQTGTAEYAGGDDDYSSSVAISGDGSHVFLTGTGGQDFLTVAFDTSTLVPLWSSRYDGKHGFDGANAITVSPDGGRVYVTGESEKGGIACFGDVASTAYATVSYAADSGDPLWVSRYPGLRRDPDQAEQIAVSPGGSSVFVSGNSDFGCRGSDVATLDYTP
jgi:hypothetical protein